MTGGDSGGGDGAEDGGDNGSGGNWRDDGMIGGGMIGCCGHGGGGSGNGNSCGVEGWLDGGGVETEWQAPHPMQLPTAPHLTRHDAG